MFWEVWAGLACLLLGLAWVGWGFFYRPVSLPAAGGKRVATDWGRLARVRLRMWRRWRMRADRYRPQQFGRVPPGGRRWLLVLLLAVMLMVGLTIWLTLRAASRQRPVAPAKPTFQRMAIIRSALSQEKLVPPPPLPPAAFVNAVKEAPGLETADREWSKLDPEFVRQLLKLFAAMPARGYPVALLEGYRSPERQERLAGLDHVVTHAGAFQSKHQFGFAADLAPVRGGKVVISERDPWAMAAYLVLGEEAEALGLGWGGRFSFKDYGHIELRGSIASLLTSRQRLAELKQGR